MVSLPAIIQSPRQTGNKWLAALVFLMLGLLIYIHGFVQTLPYQLEPDEPNIWLFANHLVTTGQVFTPGKSPYPPLRIIEIALEHRLLYLITPEGKLAQPIYYVMGRYFSVLYAGLLLAVTYQAGRHLHSRAAGLAAMLFLIVQPDAIHMAKLMKADVMAWLFGMITILLTARAVSKGPRWLIGPALTAGALATLGKYTMLPILVIPWLAWMLLIPRRSVTRAALIGLTIILLAIGTLVVLNPPEPLASFLLRFQARQLYERETVFRFVSLGHAWPALLKQLGTISFWSVVIGLPFAALIWPQMPVSHRQWAVLGIVAVTMVATFLLLGLFRTNRVQDRYVIVLGFALLWGITLALFTKQRFYLTALLALILMGPRLIEGWTYGSTLRQPDTRAITADWFIANVPEGVHIAVEKDFVEFQRGYGGFPSEKIFFIEEINSVYDRTLEEFARAGIEYLIADYRNIYRGGFFEPGHDNSAFLASVETVLNLADPPPWERGWQGPARYIFRIPPVQQHPMHVFLGDAVIFKGYDLASDAIAPGETLNLTLYWAALRETDANYIVFAHLLAQDGALAAQLDGPPGDAEHRTYDWWPGYFDWDEWPIEIPPDVPGGTYTLVIGMYDADTGIRLQATDSDGTPLGDRVVLDTIYVEP